jgi:hypothetical protein
VSFEGCIERELHIAKIIPFMLFNYVFISCIAYMVPKNNVIMNFEGLEACCFSLRIVPQEFSLLHFVQTGSGVHPTSYTMGTGGKAAGA